MEGLQRASELALIGDPISPQKMHEWGVVNAVVSPEELIPTALKWARKICANSPDAVIVSRTGMLMSLESISLSVVIDTGFRLRQQVTDGRWES